MCIDSLENKNVKLEVDGEDLWQVTEMQTPIGIDWGDLGAVLST